MNVTIEDEKFCQKVMNAEIPWETIEKDFTDAYQKLNKSVVIPGFRKGKAPLTLVKNKFKKEVVEDLKDELPFKYFKEYMDSYKLSYIGDPSLRTVTLEEQKNLKFSIIYEALPDLSSIDLKQISINEVKENTVTAEDIDQALQNLRKSHAVLSPLPEDKLVEVNDYIKFDYELLKDDKTSHVERIEQENELEKGPIPYLLDNIELVLSEEFLKRLFSDSDVSDEKIKEFIGFITSMKTGDDKIFEMESPIPLMKYFNVKENLEKLTGEVDSSLPKKHFIRIKIKEAKKFDLPELNDDFAQMVINEKDLSKLRNQIVEELKENARENTKNEMKWAVLNEIFKKYQYDVPKTLVKERFERMKKMKEHHHSHESENDDIGSDVHQEEEEQEALQVYVTTKIDLLYDHIIKTNKLEVSKEKIDEQVAKIAKASNQENTPAFYQKLSAEGIIRRLKDKLMLDSVVDYMLANIIMLPPKEEIS
jgi:trigger factor